MNLSAKEAMAQLQDSHQIFVGLFKHGTLTVEVYKPHEVEHQ